MASHRAEPPAGRQRVSRRRTRQARRSTERSPLASLSVPQVGIASALGVATIAAPMTGLMAGPPPKATVPEVSVVTAAAPVFPRLAKLPNAVEDLRLVPDDRISPVVPQNLAAPRTLLVTRASRSSERPVLPGCDGEVPAGKTSNGKLPSSHLCTLWDPDHRLRADAAIALARLNVAYRQRFGHPICITDSYRTLSEQYAVKAERGSLAAQPGTSEHGEGLAVDLCDGVQDYGTTTYTWLRANAPRYGWDNPDWALPSGSGPHEAWHWEYFPGVEAQSGN